MIRFVPIKDDNEKVYIIMNDIIIGKLNYYITKDIIKINYILVFNMYRGEGFGREIIEYIIKLNPGRVLCGDALPEAVKFWKKMGAEFSDPLPSKFKPEVLLTPFTINN